ncbi:phosphopantetheine-binding protein, partial [Achromobacter xylosoxidans]
GLDALPLSANGKIDRRALPMPQWDDAAALTPPEGEIETLIARVWHEVLGAQAIGRDSNFFELGGDSILSLQI